LNDPLIIEAINLFNAEVQDVMRAFTASEMEKILANVSQAGRERRHA